jgi:hypothetical protein
MRTDSVAHRIDLPRYLVDIWQIYCSGRSSVSENVSADKRSDVDVRGCSPHGELTRYVLHKTFVTPTFVTARNVCE